MSYGLINGAAINDSEDGESTEGIELVTVSPHTINMVAVSVGAHVLEIGDHAAEFAAEPPGLELVTHEPHLLFYNAALEPAGLDLVRTAPHIMQTTLISAGARPLEFGAMVAQNGVDVAASPYGIDLMRTGLHSILRANTGPTHVLTPGNARPLSMGVPAVSFGAAAISSGGAQPLELGAPGGVSVGLQSVGATPMSLGDHSTGITISAGGARPVSFGNHGVEVALSIGGIDLARPGQHSITIAGVFLQSVGAQPLEFGAPGQPGVALYARQNFPMKLGNHSIHRGATC